MGKSKTRKPRSNVAAMKKQAMQMMLYENQLGMHSNGGRSEWYMIAVIIMFWVLHREYGFGKKRLAVMVHEVNAFCRDYIAVGEDGTRRCDREGFKGLSLQDMVDALKEECDVQIDLKTGILTVPGVEKKEGKDDD